MKLKALPAAGALTAVLLATGASSGMATTSTATTSTAPKASTVNVVIKEWRFTASKVSVPAGKVTFVVRNAGTMKHQFVVIRTDRAPQALPMKGRQASEAGAKGKIEELARGLTKRLTLTLAPGKYVLLCNLPGHYKRGLAVRLVVTPVPSAEQTTNVSVSMFEMGFKLSETTVPRGTVVFDVRNDGKLSHDFRIRGQGTPLLDSGERATLTIRFPEPGTFTFICTVEGHAGAGQIGKLIVR